MPIIGHHEIESLIPHQGMMCLLDQVICWDKTTIHCTSQSHCSPMNPLRKNNKLSAIHAIEYGAQAMAVHGALIAKSKGEVMSPGYLAAIRNVEIKCKFLDNINHQIEVYATQILSQGGNFVYQFEVKNDSVSLATGKITIIQMEMEK